MIIVVGGVSGTGKTTVGRALAARLGWTFVDADDLHPAANVAKMRAGEPLSDEDRWPWLEVVAARMSAEDAAGRSAVVACSALRRPYRDLLRKEATADVAFCLLEADPDELAARLARRTGHFMPASLLASQLAVLEPLGPDEVGATVAAEGDQDAVVDRALAALADLLP